MARLIPKVDTSTIANNGERIVAQALAQQLPSDCVVYHSFPWLRAQRHERTGKEYLQPGETDFVLVHPQKGVLVLEVKGGTLELMGGTGEWLRRETGERIQDPFRQAEKNKYALRTRILEHPAIAGGSRPFTMGHAVVFPHSRYQGTLPAHVDRAILFDADDVANIEKKVNQAFDLWCPVRNPDPLDRPLLDAIVESLSPAFQLTPVLWRTIEDQEERLKRLTEDQARILDFLRNHERAAIEGVAGSGKTILAVAQAQRFARRGLRTLFVCYNKPLADWLADQQPVAYRDAITISTFHSLCADFCRKAKIAFPVQRMDDDFWKWEAPELLEQAAALVAPEHGFDAIVVDEGQDFQDFWWGALEKLYRRPGGKGPLYVFFDPKQNIYVEYPSLPSDLGQPYPLITNCRNTQRIAAYCADIVGVALDTLQDTPEGLPPKVSDAPNLREVIRATQRVVNDWCLRERGGLQPRQVAILTPQLDPKAWPDRLGNIRLVTDFGAWRANQGILLAIHRRFKGLEADGLILAGVPKPGTHKHYTTADHYVASSRAKHLLEIIHDLSL